jgi:integrase
LRYVRETNLRFGHISQPKPYCRNLVLQLRTGGRTDRDEGFILSWGFRWTETLATGIYKAALIGLGSYRDVSIPEAREKALIYRRMLEDGKDPRIERANALCDAQSAKDHFRTLSQVILEYAADKLPVKSTASPQGYSSGYVDKIKRCLRDYVESKVHPKLGMVGNLPIQKINFHMLFDTPSEQEDRWGCDLRTLWVTKHPSARDMLVHLRAMFGYAKAHGYYIGDNPVGKELTKAVLPAPRTFYVPKQHKGVPYLEAPAFVQRLRNFRHTREWHLVGPDGRPIPAYLLEWIVLTGVRIREASEAKWKEIDLVTMTWTVPVERLKTKYRKGKLRDEGLARPITSSMLRILKDMQVMREDPSDRDAFIFRSPVKPNRKSLPVIGHDTLIRILRRNLGIQISAEENEKAKAERLRQCAEIDARIDLTRNEKIRAKRATGMSLGELGADYGITKQTVFRIVRSLPKETGNKPLMGEEELVNHAFRTTLLDWVRNETEWREVYWRAQVDHELGETQADSHYGADVLLPKRRVMMQQWDNYLNAPPPIATGGTNVITLSNRRTG